MRLSVVKQSFFGPPGQYGRLVTRANRAFPSSLQPLFHGMPKSEVFVVNISFQLH